MNEMNSNQALIWIAWEHACERNEDITAMTSRLDPDSVDLRDAIMKALEAESHLHCGTLRHDARGICDLTPWGHTAVIWWEDNNGYTEWCDLIDAPDGEAVATVRIACRMMAGMRLRSPESDEIAALVHNPWWDGLWPLVDGDACYTGEYTTSDDEIGYLNVEDIAVIRRDVAEAAGWTIEAGDAYPPQD
jgi:hypothetical protein